MPNYILPKFFFHKLSYYIAIMYTQFEIEIVMSELPIRENTSLIIQLYHTNSEALKNTKNSRTFADEIARLRERESKEGVSTSSIGVVRKISLFINFKNTI